MTRAHTTPGRYKYDAALSFAGEDRKIAKALFRQLRRRGFSVFYDADRQADLWGKTPEAFEQIYGPQARYVIPLVSRHYAQKDWTLYEFETAKREQRKRQGEFILPVRLDDTRLLGLSDGAIRIDARKVKVAQIAKMFADKCRLRRRTTGLHRGRLQTAALGLIKQDARRALGLIATAALPLPQAYFKTLFPQYDWRRLVGEFRHAGLIVPGNDSLLLSEPALAALRGDQPERKALNQLWIDRLTPLQAHVDTAAFLSLHLIAARRFEEAARVAVTIAHNTSLEQWNQAYVALLLALRRRRLFPKLSRRTQVELLNSLGTGLSHAGRYREAMRTFSDLRRRSKSYRNSWGVGQSLINAGVAAHTHGDAALSTKLYVRAVAHARRSRDQMLLGRALSNLAQSVQGRDLPSAERLLEESLRAKAAAKDSAGLATGLAVRAGLAVARKQFVAAARWYAMSARAFARLRMPHEYALSTYNHGRALQDAGSYPRALSLYAKARELAVRSNYNDVLILSLNALGAATFDRKRYSKSRECAIALLDVAGRLHDEDQQLGALHMLAVSLVALGRRREAASHFRLAIERARERKADEFVARCLIDSTRRATKGGIGNPDRVRLRNIVSGQIATDRKVVAAHIWRVIARLSAQGSSDQEASEAYKAAARNLSSHPTTTATTVDIYKEWYAWAWRRHRYVEATNVLLALERFARRHADDAQAIGARDQRGVCLQEIGKHADAEALHCTAAQMARRIGDSEQEERSLNNLGEALRKQDRPRDAIVAFKASEKIARGARRYNEAISSEHNRALALESLGELHAAERVFRECRGDAKRRQLWYEYVRAWEGLANLTAMASRHAAALRLYRRAMREARGHRIDDVQPRIALNLARLLLADNQPKAGLTALKKFQGTFEHFVDAHHYFGTLAELNDAAGWMRAALAAWNRAKSHAQLVGDVKYVTYCSSHEARVLEHLEKTRVSESALRLAIKAEREPKRRAKLLIRLLGLLLRARRKTAAQAAFDEGLQFCTQHRLRAQKSELYILIGDNEFSGNYAAKLTAFKAYTMAIATCLESDMSASARIASRIVFKIALERPAVKRKDIARLIRDLTNYLATEAPTAPDQVLRYLVWPFHVAEQLLPLRDQTGRLLKAVETLISPESIKRYLGTVRTRGAGQRQRRPSHSMRANSRLAASAH